MKNFPEELQHASGRMMTLDNTRLLLSFKEPPSLKELEAMLKKSGLELEDIRQDPKTKDSSRSLQPVINHTATKFWVRSSTGRPIDDEWLDKINNVFLEFINWVGPVYRLANTSGYEGLLCPLPDVVLLGKKRQKNIRINEENQPPEDKTKEIAEKYGLAEVEEKSKYLTAYRYFKLKDSRKANAYSIKVQLKEFTNIIGEARFENMPLLKPIASTIPNDTLWTDQWNMTQINAPDAWDISAGSNTVVICVLDEGCDLTHPDLQFSEDGINLGTMMPTGAPTGNHGTACAGIVAATFNNNEGVAGVAGNCLVMPVAFDSWTDVECANGINYASTNGARVISMSFGWDPWDHTVIDPEIQNAFDNDVVMCVATHNHYGAITYPATNPLVLAIGASEQTDNKTDFSDWGDIVYNGTLTGVSVVAPGVSIPTTDRQGADGYNSTAGPGGNYTMDFGGTSAATPHVAGLSGLIRSQYPSLTNIEVRNIIERTAAKVGTTAYAEMTGFSNGTRNEEMGYGRIDAFQSLDIADIMIKDWSGDDGTEPSNPPGGDFWDFSDIVVRILDDNVFNPSNPSQSKNVERGQKNFIYIQVTNKGPRDARNVIVDCRITPWIGTQFRYPDDWTFIDAMHVKPTHITNTFATVAAGATVMAKFKITTAQTETLYGWEYLNPWHPCLLASVQADNDYAFTAASFAADPLSQLKNNLAQRNLSVIDVLASATATTMSFPFIAGHLKNTDRFMDIVVENVSKVAGVKMFLNLDDDGKAFPLVDFNEVNAGAEEDSEDGDCESNGLVFLETTKIETTLGCCRGTLTVVKGSRFDCMHKSVLKPLEVKGGEVIIRNGKRYVELREQKTIVKVSKQPGIIYPLSVVFELPANVEKNSELNFRVSQRDAKGTTVGGATAIYYIK